VAFQEEYFAKKLQSFVELAPPQSLGDEVERMGRKGKEM
jgi:hypothetical protein